MGWRRFPKKKKQFTVSPQDKWDPARVQNACYGLSAEVIATLCQVDVATARRWKRGDSRMPFTAQAVVLGDLGAFSKHWDGWRIRGGEILSPDGWVIDRNHALSLPLMEAQLRAKDGQIAALQAEIAELKSWLQKNEQPPPQDQLPKIITTA